jgi:hypothetical protein
MPSEDLKQALALIQRLTEAAQVTIRELEATPAAPTTAAEPERQVIYSGLDTEARSLLSDALLTSELITVIKDLRRAAGSRMTPELREAADRAQAKLVDINRGIRGRIAA